MSMMNRPLTDRQTLMTLTQLRTFLAVAELGSVRAAADQLVVSQPAVSGAIGALKRELGVELLEPFGRGVRPTPAGAAFAASVRATLAHLDHGVRVARSVEDPRRGAVRIAAIATAAEAVLLPLLGDFRQQFPDVALTIEVGNRSAVWEALSNFAVDLVVAGRPPAALQARVLGQSANTLVVVGRSADAGPPPSQPRSAVAVPPSREPPAADPAGTCPAATHPAVTHPAGTYRAGTYRAGTYRAGTHPAATGHEAIDRLATATWLLREEGSGTREATDELLEQLGIDPPKMILGSNGAVQQAVIAGFGIGLLPLASVGERISAGLLAPVPCPGTPIERPWHLVASGAVSLPAAAELAARSLLDRPDGFSSAFPR